MAEDSRARLKEWLASGAVRLEPLSFSQRELWESSIVPPGDSCNHICVFMEVAGKVSKEDCLAAMQELVDRHEVMRLSILPGKNGPVQMIRREFPAAMRFSDLAPDASLEDAMLEIFEEPFDLLRGPLYRVHVFRRGEGDHVLVMPIHHAIADGWTLGVFVENLAAAYLHIAMRLPGKLPPLPLSYSEWAAAERAAWTSGRLQDTAKYWKEHLQGSPRLWDAIPHETHRLVRTTSAISAELTTAVRDLAKRSDATLFSTLLAGFQLALAEWTGERDLVVGSPVANRTKAAVREAMGYCSGIVPIRSLVDPDRSLEDSVRAAHASAMDAFANAMPFAELVRAVEIHPAPHRNPIFDVRFALQNHPIPDTVVPGFSVKLHMRSTGTARCDLGCELTEMGDGLEIVWLYRKEKFTQSDIDELERLFLTALAGNSPELASVGYAD